MLFRFDDFSARFSDFRTRAFFQQRLEIVFACRQHATTTTITTATATRCECDGRPTVDDDTRNNKIDSTSTVSADGGACVDTYAALTAIAVVTAAVQDY